MENGKILEKLQVINIDVLNKIKLDEYNNITIDGSTVQETISNWNSSKTDAYKKDIIVIYNNNFYQCIVANATNGTFVESEWKNIGGSSSSNIDYTLNQW